MRALSLVYNALPTLVLSAAVVFSAAVELDKRQSACEPYTVFPYVLDFEDIRPNCFFNCLLQQPLNLSSPRGAGLAYRRFEYMEKPLLLGNVHHWQGINCTWEGFAGKEERNACGNSSKAIYSPGKSPWDPSIKPRVGSLDFPDTYSMGSLDALYITPLRLPAGTGEASVEITGLGLGGKKVTYVAKLDIASGKKRFLISGLKARGFDHIRALELWVSVGGKGGYEFALDDLVLEEYRPAPGCSFEPKPEPEYFPGPCTPRPQKTTKFTINAEEFKEQSGVQGLYKSIYWNSYAAVYNSSTLSEYQFRPAPIPVRPGKNFYHSYSAFSLNAHTYKQRFGVESLYIACNFPAWQEPDYSGTNGRPCHISFIGRRDPYDGDNYPDLVIANLTIPNPLNVTTQKFTKVDLNKLTDKPGRFTRLYKFIIIATVGDYNTYQNIVFDNIKFSRETFADDHKCRARGYKELTFDDIKTGATGLAPLPERYKDFSFTEFWAVTSRSRYPQGSPGYAAVISRPNALYSNPSPSEEVWAQYIIDSYTSPIENFLFSIEEFRLTVDITNPADLPNVTVNINVVDACGTSSYAFSEPMTEFIPNMYFRSLTLSNFSYLFAEPLAAISQISIYAWKVDPITGEQVRLNFWIDNLRYRKWDKPTPGCWRCGRRGGDWCEVPRGNKFGQWLDG